MDNPGASASSTKSAASSPWSSFSPSRRPPRSRRSDPAGCLSDTRRRRGRVCAKRRSSRRSRSSAAWRPGRRARSSAARWMTSSRCSKTSGRCQASSRSARPTPKAGRLSSKEAADEEHSPTPSSLRSSGPPTLVVERADLLLVQAKPLQGAACAATGTPRSEVAGALRPLQPGFAARGGHQQERSSARPRPEPPPASSLVGRPSGRDARHLAAARRAEMPAASFSGLRTDIWRCRPDVRFRSDEVSDVARASNAFLENLQALVAEVAQPGPSRGDRTDLAVATKCGAPRKPRDDAAASASEMSNIVGQIAGNSQDAADAAQLALEKARAGGEVVDLGIDEIRSPAVSPPSPAGQQRRRSVASTGSWSSSGHRPADQRAGANASIEPAPERGQRLRSHCPKSQLDGPPSRPRRSSGSSSRSGRDAPGARLDGRAAEVERSSELSQRGRRAPEIVMHRGNSTLVRRASGTRQQNGR